MRAMSKKLRKNRSGFSLSETLIAILILLMVSAIVAGALPTASSVFTKTVDTANAQILMSTAITVLRDELGTATRINEGTYTTFVEYMSGATGSWSKLEITQDGLQISSGKSEASNGSTNYKDVRMLVSDKAATSKMQVFCESITKNSDGTITVNNLAVRKKGSSAETAAIVGPRTVKIRPVA